MTGISTSFGLGTWTALLLGSTVYPCTEEGLTLPIVPPIFNGSSKTPMFDSGVRFSIGLKTNGWEKAWPRVDMDMNVISSFLTCPSQGAWALISPPNSRKAG